MKRHNIVTFLCIAAAVVLCIVVSGFVLLRTDLTQDKRYTVSQQGRDIISDLDDIVYIKVYLDGDMPVYMKKFRNSIRETLDNLRRYSKGNLMYELKDLDENPELRGQMEKELSAKGLIPVPIIETNDEGAVTEKLVFPGVSVNYGGRETFVNLLQQNGMISAEENVNYSVQNLEYQIVNAIKKLSLKKRTDIAFIYGHDELDSLQTFDLVKDLSRFYSVDRVQINGRVDVLDKYKAVIIAKPMASWPEEDKFVLDQYIMNGGNTAWFIDAVHIHEDSLAKGEITFGMACEHNLNDQLFNYGIRINHNVIQDLVCAGQALNVAQGGVPDIRPFPWTYFPLLWPPDDNPITKGLNLVLAKYPGVIDTVGKSTDVKKSFLLRSSDKSRAMSAPMMISLSQIHDNIDESKYSMQYLPVAASLEGVFTSPFRNRSVSKYLGNGGRKFVAESSPKTKMVIVSDGDIIRNDVVMSSQGPRIVPLGYDRSTDIMYGNKDFCKNVIDFLTEEDGLTELKSRSFKMRLLDKAKIVKSKKTIIAVNTVLPAMVVVFAGLAFTIIRRRRYAA